MLLSFSLIMLIQNVLVSYKYELMTSKLCQHCVQTEEIKSVGLIIAGRFSTSATKYESSFHLSTHRL